MYFSFKNAKKSIKSEFSILLVLIFICVIISLITKDFANINNFLNIIRRSSTIGIVAIGMTFVIATGGIDLSVGGQVSLVSILGTYLLTGGMSFGVVIILMIILGAVMGCINGLFITRLKLPPFMVTLAMLNITFGLAMFLTRGRTLYDIPRSFGAIGQNNFLGIPISAFIFIVCAAIGMIILNKFTLGRRILAVGGNLTGAWYAGINVSRTVLIAYIINGITAGISSVILVSRLLSASPSLGNGLELDAIGAVVIGGTSLAGGEGYIVGTVAGVLIIQVIMNWMNLIALDPFLRDVMKGSIILLALIIDVLRKGKLNKQNSISNN